ncbi:unnamed protein product [Effrenium voratum]|nr:unnamed protein product [Effrenium voratum]
MAPTASTSEHRARLVAPTKEEVQRGFNALDKTSGGWLSKDAFFQGVRQPGWLRSVVLRFFGPTLLEQAEAELQAGPGAGEAAAAAGAQAQRAGAQLEAPGPAPLAYSGRAGAVAPVTGLAETPKAQPWTSPLEWTGGRAAGGGGLVAGART